MDRSLLLLLILSVVLLAIFAPQATLTFTAIVTMSVLATQGSWVLVRALVPSKVSKLMD